MPCKIALSFFTLESLCLVLKLAPRETDHVRGLYQWYTNGIQTVFEIQFFFFLLMNKTIDDYVILLNRQYLKAFGD